MIVKSYILENNIDELRKNLILFYGENEGLKEQFKKNIKFNFKKAKILIFTQDELLKNLDLLYKEILNASLFEEEKILFINNVNDKILSILQEIEKKITSDKIYLFADILEKKSKLRNYFEKSINLAVIPCYADNELSIKKIILEKLKGFSGLNTENINLIIENCNLNRIKLNNELSKIHTFFYEKKIDKKQLETLLNVNVNDNFNELKDEALKGNQSKTNKLINETLIENDKNFMYLNLINQRLLKIADVLRLKTKDNIEVAINSLKPPIFWKDKPAFIIQTRKWNLNKINEVLEKTYKLELDIKSNSNINHNILIKKLLVDICNQANT
tara:strand:+ start:264 stop:1253 length:990 start_codon:yes stop_codon:yes gene_type:complete